MAGERLIKRGQSGFTLLEILVVVFIIGIILGFASLNLGGRNLDDRIQEEANRLRALFELARDEAALTGLELGWYLEKNSYEFVMLGEEGWASYTATGPLRPRRMPEPIALKLNVEEFELGTAANPDSKQTVPQLVFFSSGEVTPFALLIGAPQTTRQYVLDGDLLGRLKLQSQDRPDYSFQ